MMCQSVESMVHAQLPDHVPSEIGTLLMASTVFFLVD
jgi:hypothetical protein